MFFDPGPGYREVLYQFGHMHNTQYITLDPGEQAHIREMLELFLGHIYYRAGASDFDDTAYDMVFNQPVKDLPKPDFKRTGKRYNTWDSFLTGVEQNFKNGTRDFSAKQLPHIAEAYNMAVIYFTQHYPEFEPSMQVRPIKFVRA